MCEDDDDDDAAAGGTCRGGGGQLKAFKMRSAVSLAGVISGLIKATLAVLLPTILKELFKLSALV